jgi:hypothetical protein
MDAIELDPYAAEAVQEWRQAKADIVEAEAREVKAKDAVRGFLLSHDAKTGLVDGEPVVEAGHYTRETVDTAALKRDQRAIHDQYLRPVQVSTLRLK